MYNFQSVEKDALISGLPVSTKYQMVMLGSSLNSVQRSFYDTDSFPSCVHLLPRAVLLEC